MAKSKKILKHDFKEGDKVTLSYVAGYSKKQCADVYTVDEIHGDGLTTDTITVLSPGVSLTKPVSEFKKYVAPVQEEEAVLHCSDCGEEYIQDGQEYCTSCGGEMTTEDDEFTRR